jgi:cardiolipin synthase
MATSETVAPFRDPPSFTTEAQGHRLHFVPGGPERMVELLALIDSAQKSLRIAFYIFAPDASGRKVRDALVGAARRGVHVRLVVDGFGAAADADFFAPLVEAGGTFCRFLPKWNVRYLIRNHQKLVIVDDLKAMLGGFNVEDSYFESPGLDAWTDLAVIVEGPAVERVAAWFDMMERWAMDPHANLGAIRRLVREWTARPGTVQVLIGGPTRGLSSWARHVGDRLRSVRRLDMIMAYFSPTPQLSHRIARIAQGGGARLVLPARSDNGATVGASRAFYSGLLKGGTELWEYEAAMLHSKLIVADDWVYLGSANFDMRSLYLNLEIMLCIEDAALAERMRGLIDAYLPASTRITPDLHKTRAGWWNRLRWLAGWFLVGVVDYSVSRKLNLGL